MTEKMFRCTCGCGIISIDDIEGEDVVYLSHYILSGYKKSSIIERLEIIWSAIIGKEYLLYGVVIDKKEWNEYKNEK